MATYDRQRVLFTILLIACFTFLLYACNAPLMAPASEGGGDQSPFEPINLSGGDGSDSGADSGEGNTDDVPLAPLVCPEGNQVATLRFDHDVGWGPAGEFDINVKASGSVQFNLVRSIATFEPTEEVGIHVINPGLVTADITASAKDCVQNQKSTLTFIPEVRGTCYDGVFNITIKEVWQQSKVVLYCDDGDKVHIQLPFGPQGRQASGPISLIASQEHRFPYNFAGPGGRGQFVYYLSYQPSQ